MKKLRILLVVALVAIISSCGGQGDTKSESGLSNDADELKQIFETTPFKDIHIIKYKGTLGDSHITVQLQNEAGLSQYADRKTLYMYDEINNPLKLEYDQTKDYICLNELFPKKNEEGYKKGGTLSFKNNKELTFEMTGEYVNPKGTKTYPVHLQAVEIITKVQKENFEELQEHRTDKHYFTVESAWGVDLQDTIRFVKQINVYDKKTNKKLQSLPIPFGEYRSFACVEPTNTKPNGIQIGCCPSWDVNPNYYYDYIAFLPKNGKYEKDSLVQGHSEYELGTTMFRGYNENGDIFEESGYNERETYHNIIYVTTKRDFDESRSEDIPSNIVEIRREYDTYVEEFKIIPFDYDFEPDTKPIYMEIFKTDKETGESSYTIETNYEKKSYELSADGKTLLKWKDSYGLILDFNGQDDLRGVEKIATDAFEYYADVDLGMNGYHQFMIKLNPNFKDIPEAIKKYERLKERTYLSK